jgi:death-on-curing protein
VSDDVIYLLLDDIVELIRDLGVGPIRDLGLLDSALGRARSSAFGVDIYASVELKAAALLDSVTNNHALVDGNKRLGLLAAAVFLDLNGYRIGCSDEAAFELVWEVADSHVALPQVVQRLEISRKRRRAQRREPSS